MTDIEKAFCRSDPQARLALRFDHLPAKAQRLFDEHYRKELVKGGIIVESVVEDGEDEAVAVKFDEKMAMDVKFAEHFEEGLYCETSSFEYTK